MKPYVVEALYRRFNHPGLRLAAIRGARALGVRHLMVRIDTNDVCNLRCPMCYMSDPDRVPSAPAMTTERFAAIADEVFPRTRFLYLSCGTEPLATPHFDEILDVTGRHRVPFTSFCTNGILLRDRFIDATLRNRVSEVIISVDGASAETYEKIRVGATWAKLNERLEALRRKTAGFPGRAPEFRFNFTAQADNVHELEAFANWALQWKPATLQFRMFRPLAGAVKQGDDVRTVREFRARLPAVRALCARHGVHVEVQDVPDEGLATDVREALNATGPAAPAAAVAETTVADAAITEPAVAQRSEAQPATSATGAVASPAQPADGAPRPRSINCQLPWVTLYIKPDGALWPCPAHPPVGNLFESTYAEIERGPAMTELRHSLRRCPKSICIECQRKGTSGVGG